MAELAYVAEVQPRVCSCKLPPKSLGVFRSLDKAVAVMQGYWAVYVGFYGDQTMWLHFQVVDARDGTLLWSNGRRMTNREVQQHGSTLW